MSEPIRIQNGNTISWVINLKDAFGNPLTTAAATVEGYVEVTIPAGTQSAADALAYVDVTQYTDANGANVDGAYQVDFDASGAGFTAGVYQLVLDGWAAGIEPVVHEWTVNVHTDAADALSDYDAPTKAELDSAVSGLQGPGSSEQDITIKVDGVAVADADVWITSDAAGDNVVYGTYQTGSDGKPTTQPMLDAGVTYYLWMQKDGANPINGEAFVAE